jgi:predicted ATPase/DNA-binding CsgD family transcriptional regulator
VGEGPAGDFPVPLTPLIGRERELAGARVLLAGGRLLTLVGVGGSGKTRLALEVVRGEPGAVFVDLAPVREPGQFLPAVARALGLREAGAQPLPVTLYRYLRQWGALLVLDNFEHLLEAAGELAGLLQRCPEMRVLVTSRAPLQVPGEQLLQVQPLPVPDLRALPAPAELAAISSVALFAARVRAAQPDFAVDAGNARTIAEVCLALDGLPLALELAAAQVRRYGLAEVLARSRGRFMLWQSPRRGVPDRHRTLAGAIQWSVALLDAPAAALFRRLSVFAGGWTASAAAEVCGEPGMDVPALLATLVDQSLVVAAETRSGLRYRMLETLREFAAAQLDLHRERERFRRRHLSWCCGIGAMVARLGNPDDERLPALDLAEAEFDNLAASLEGCGPAHVTDALQLAGDLYHLWDSRGHLGEGCRHLERLLARPQATVDLAVRAKALDALGLLRLWQDDHAAARALLGESARLAQRTGDLDRWAWTTSSLVISRAMGGDLDGTESLALGAVEVARAHGTRASLARALCGLALLRSAQGRQAEASQLMEQCLQLLDYMTWARGKFSYFLGWFAFLDGNLDRAAELLATSLGAFELMGERRSLPDTVDALGCLAEARGQPAEALRRFAEAQAMRAAAGSCRNGYLARRCTLAEVRARAAQADVDPPPGITAREFQVAHLVADGLTNRQIGRQLAISERTAERHVENLRRKLGVGTRAQVAAWVSALPTPG